MAATIIKKYRNSNTSVPEQPENQPSPTEFLRYNHRSWSHNTQFISTVDMFWMTSADLTRTPTGCHNTDTAHFVYCNSGELSTGVWGWSIKTVSAGCTPTWSSCRRTRCTSSSSQDSCQSCSSSTGPMPTTRQMITR